MKLKDEILLQRLRKMGAPLGTDSKIIGNNENLIPPEEVLVRGLSLARRNPAVARVFPVIIVRNIKYFDDFGTIENFVRSAGEADTLGFFLELTGELTGNSHFSDLANRLAGHRHGETRDFFVHTGKGRYARKLDELNTPDVAKRWNFRMNMNTESFRTLFNKFGVTS